MLHVIDSQWKDHLLSMDHLKEGIGLRGYGQRDPLTEYKREAFDLFQEMVDRVRTSVPSSSSRCRSSATRSPSPRPARPAVAPPRPAAHGVRRRALAGRARAAARGGAERAEGRPERSCPCGSGKKYKKCCLAKGA